MQFHIVDVFAQRRYTGNQLAVVTDAADLTSREMQAIAAEFDYSETTFLTGGEGWTTRIFTPTAEVPFAGHPTLGTAAVVREHLAPDRPNRVTLDLPVGPIPVESRQVDGVETLWMRQQPPTFGARLAHADLAPVLGLSPDQLDREWPVQVVSTGLPTVVVPLVDRDAIAAVDLDRTAYERFVAGRDVKLVLAVCPEPRDPGNDLAVRVFAPHYGVPEDPATGSANGCLAAYLSRHEYLGDTTVDARAEQGHELGRPSRLFLAVDPAGETLTVEVGGRVVPVARGELLTD